jgi:hypothetical protein
MLRFLLILFVAMSCTTRPTQTQLKNADYGKVKRDYKQEIQNLLTMHWKDPDSVKYKWIGEPIKWYNGGAFGTSLNYGWGICMYANAKNGFGAYNGFKKFFIMYRDGRLLDLRKDSSGSICKGYKVPAFNDFHMLATD